MTQTNKYNLNISINLSNVIGTYFVARTLHTTPFFVYLYLFDNSTMWHERNIFVPTKIVKLSYFIMLRKM